ncbi:MAG: hypothetical protein IIY96_07935 [Lachnospiraceae bacterium]|nr:hypothetical protein [Lachnospiraceae bacterium]
MEVCGPSEGVLTAMTGYTLPVKAEIHREQAVSISRRNRLIFLVYYVDEAVPFRPREARLLTTNAEKAKEYLEEQILCGSVQYGEQFTSAGQLREFRKDWRSRPRRFLNSMMRYGSISAEVDGKELDGFRLNLPRSGPACIPVCGKGYGYIYLVCSLSGRSPEARLFTADPDRVKAYFRDRLRKGEIRYGEEPTAAGQLEEFLADWQTKPGAVINGKLSNCSLTAVIDGKRLDTAFLS